MRTDILLIRLVFTAILTGAGYFLRPIPGDPALSAIAGALIAISIIFFEIRIRRATLKTLIGAAVGSILGIVGAYMIGTLTNSTQAGSPEMKAALILVLIFFMAYVGLMVGAAKGD